MNWVAFTLSVVAVLVWVASMLVTFKFLEWVERKFGLGVSVGVAITGFALCVGALVGPNA